MTTQEKIRELKGKTTEYMWLAEIVEQYKDIAEKIADGYIVNFAPLHNEEYPYRLNPHYPINGSYIVAALQSRIKDMEAEMAEIEKQIDKLTTPRVTYVQAEENTRRDSRGQASPACQPHRPQ